MKIFLVLIVMKFVISSGEIISVVEVNRHGARTPKNFASKSRQLFYGSQNMQLTINGFRQEQILGEYVKKKYSVKNHLISKRYSKKEFSLVSSPTERTIFSAAGFISGLFPGSVVKMDYGQGSGMFLQDTIPFEPPFKNSAEEIPINVRSLQTDSLFHALECDYKGKKLYKWLKEGTSEIYRISELEKEAAVAEFSEYLSLKGDVSLSGGADETLKQISKYHSPFTYHFKSATTTKKVSHKSEDTLKKFMINKWYNSRVRDNKYMRIALGELYGSILENFRKAVSHFESKKEYVKFAVFSGHDTVIVNILSNILKKTYLAKLVGNAPHNPKFYKFIVPPFASSVFFELHEQKGEYHVEVIYNGLNLTKKTRFSKRQGKKVKHADFDTFISSQIDKDYKKLDCSKVE